MKLLIVDDEELTRTGVISSLDWTALGIDEVLQADDGVHGLETARLYKPEIILCDVRMPRMDGISMLERYKDTGAAKPYLIFALTDETYSVVCSGGVPEGVDRKKYYFWVSLLNQLYWIAGGVAGALLGSVLPFDTTGIDFSMTALFLVVMTEQWKASRDHTPALVGLGVSLVCLLIFGSSDFLIPSMVGITAALTVLRGFMQKKEADHAV